MARTLHTAQGLSTKAKTYDIMIYDPHKRGMNILIHAPTTDKQSKIKQHTFTILSPNGCRSVLVNNSEQTVGLERVSTKRRELP